MKERLMTEVIGVLAPWPKRTEHFIVGDPFLLIHTLDKLST